MDLYEQTHMHTILPRHAPRQVTQQKGIGGAAWCSNHVYEHPTNTQPRLFNYKKLSNLIHRSPFTLAISSTLAAHSNCF